MGTAEAAAGAEQFVTVTPPRARANWVQFIMRLLPHFCCHHQKYVLG
jgi:hypothetical protein